MKSLGEVLRWLDQTEAGMKTAKDCLKDENSYASASLLNRLREKLFKGFPYAQGYWTLITHSVAKLLEAS